MGHEENLALRTCVFLGACDQQTTSATSLASGHVPAARLDDARGGPPRRLTEARRSGHCCSRRVPHACTAIPAQHRIICRRPPRESQPVEREFPAAASSSNRPRSISSGSSAASFSRSRRNGFSKFVGTLLVVPKAHRAAIQRLAAASFLPKGAHRTTFGPRWLMSRWPSSTSARCRSGSSSVQHTARAPGHKAL